MVDDTEGDEDKNEQAKSVYTRTLESEMRARDKKDKYGSSPPVVNRVCTILTRGCLQVATCLNKARLQ